MAEALRECMHAMKEDPGLGKALLRTAHVHLMLGDTSNARRYYSKAERAVGTSKEAEIGLHNCLSAEQDLSRLNLEHGVCRRAASSAAASVESHSRLKQLLATVDAKLAITPHNVPLRALRCEVLSSAGRWSEARAACDKGLGTASLFTGDQRDTASQQGALWLHTLGRVLYDQSLLAEAAEKLMEALQRSGAPQGSKPLLRLAQRLDAERNDGNSAFKRGDWAGAVAAYTRALAVDPSHLKFNALLYCNRAAAHGKQGQLQQALADCSSAIVLDPTYAKVRNQQQSCKCVL